MKTFSSFCRFILLLFMQSVITKLKPPLMTCPRKLDQESDFWRSGHEVVVLFIPAYNVSTFRTSPIVASIAGSPAEYTSSVAILFA